VTPRSGLMRLAATAIAGLFISLAAAASAQTLPSADRVRGGMFDASDPAGIARFMEKTGYRVELGSDSRGDPLISGRISHSDYAIQFYECENGAFCNSVQFVAQAPKPAALTLDQINAFNARWRYARLTLNDSQVRMQMDVNLDAGVTADNLEDTLDIWRQLLEIFERDVLKLA
jgi:hypothetical protein